MLKSSNDSDSTRGRETPPDTTARRLRNDLSLRHNLPDNETNDDIFPVEMVSRPEGGDRIVVSSESHGLGGDTRPQGRLSDNHAESRHPARSGMANAYINFPSQHGEQNLARNEVGIPRIVELGDKNTVVSGIDGTVMVGSQLQGSQDSKRADHVQSSHSEETTIFGLRQFRTRYREARTNVHEATDDDDRQAVSRSGLDSPTNDDGNTISTLCGIEFSKRTKQLSFILLVGLGIALLFVALFGIGVIAPAPTLTPVPTPAPSRSTQWIEIGKVRC